jgi:hypothetical protein
MIRVWGRPTSIHTQRVLWALTDADLGYELILASATMGPQGHVSKGGAPFGVVDTPAYRAKNPNGTVPTIEDDGFVLYHWPNFYAAFHRRNWIGVDNLRRAPLVSICRDRRDS